MIVQSAIEVQRVCLQVEVNPDPETVPVPLATTLDQIFSYIVGKIEREVTTVGKCREARVIIADCLRVSGLA